MSTKIARVRGRQIIDSRGNPTVEADAGILQGGGARTPRCGAFEAHPQASTKPSNCATEIRRATLAKGVLKAVANVNGEIARAVTGLDASDQGADARPPHDRS